MLVVHCKYSWIITLISYQWFVSKKKDPRVMKYFIVSFRKRILYWFYRCFGSNNFLFWVYWFRVKENVCENVPNSVSREEFTGYNLLRPLLFLWKHWGVWKYILEIPMDKKCWMGLALMNMHWNAQLKTDEVLSESGTKTRRFPPATILFL